MTAIRIFTGPAEMLVGAVVLFLVYRMWAVSPVNRVFRLGRFVTEDGMRAVLNLRLTFLAIGVMLVAGGSSRTLFWLASRNPFDPLVAATGSLEAGFAALSSCLILYKVSALWRLK